MARNQKGSKKAPAATRNQAGRKAVKCIGQGMIQHITPESKNRFTADGHKYPQYP